MSIILDALKKAEEERKQKQGTITYGKKSPGNKPRKLSVIISAGVGFAAVLILIAVLVVPRLNLSPERTVSPAPPPARPATKSEPPVGKPVVPEKPALQGEPAAKVQTLAPTAKTAVAARAVAKADIPTRDASMREEPAVKKQAELPTAKAAGRASGASRDPVAASDTGAVPSPPKTAPKVAVAPVPRDSGRERTSGRPAIPPAREETGARPAEAGPGGREGIAIGRTVTQDAERLFGEARRLEEAGSLGEAKGLYLRVLKEYPDHVETLNNLGAMALGQGNPQEALYFFRKILDRRKDYPKVYNNAGLALMMEGNTAPAEQYFRQAIQLDRNGPEPYVNLAALLRRQGRLQEAARLLEIPLSREPKNPSLSLSYAIIKDELKQKPEALRFYRQALREGLAGEERNRVAERLKLLEHDQSAPDR